MGVFVNTPNVVHYVNWFVLFLYSLLGLGHHIFSNYYNYLLREEDDMIT